jgi:hypothetical protein
MVVDKASGKAAASTQKTTNNSMIAKKPDAAKGQMSISAFFAKKPVKSADAGTPQPPEPESKASPASSKDEHKKNLQPCFEESSSDPDVACVHPVATNTMADTHKVAEAVEHIDEDKEEDCVVVSETAPVSKSTKKDRTVASKAVKSTSHLSKLSKNREPQSAKVNKQSCATKQQNTLHFNSNQDSAKSAPKPEKIRPPHPEGLNLNCKSDVIMIAEFISKFRFETSDIARILHLAIVQED